MITKEEIKQLASELVLKLDQLNIPLGNVIDVRDRLAKTITEWLGAYTEVHVE